MATAWITYAWQDNQANDVTFIALELERMGIKIKLDRCNIQAGHRLWEQIDRFITDPKESDAWILFATANSLGSEACKEEFSYALLRGLNNRGDGYPIIALFPGTADNQLIPAGIRSRLYISLTEPHWKERILSSIEERSLSIPRPKITPYVFRVHTVPSPRGTQYALEMRPRANSWFPFFVAVPANEKDEKQCSVCHYARDTIPSRSGAFMTAGQGLSEDGKFWIETLQHEITPAISGYALCRTLPSAIAFGVHNGRPHYHIRLGSAISAV